MIRPTDSQKSRSSQGPSVQLEGQIEKITYMNEETGYTVARVNVPGTPAPVTIVGHLLALAPGEVLRMEGVWVQHPRFGRQFQVHTHRTVLPASVQGIRKYLGSGLIKGIGPVMASRIVKKFGAETLAVIDQRIDELTRVEGIGLKRVAIIKKAWADQKEIRDIMIFLREHGVGLGHATKIFKRYGQRSIAVVSGNPYRLATEIAGIGFQTADRIARRLGFQMDAPERAEAGILYVLNQMSEEGHVFYPYEPLIEKCREVLDVDREVVIRAFGTVAYEGGIVLEDLNRDLEAFEANRKAVYLKRFHVAETGTAHDLARLLEGEKRIRRPDPERAVQWAQEKIRLRLAPKQVEAVKRAISEKVLIITGGPGTGKTTIIQGVIRIFRELGAGVLLAAPTGRASKRMSEATGHPARTIHRMLEFSFQKGGFQRNRDHPLKADVLIVDEASMIDTVLMYHLLKAVPSEATLILVGDVDQLPSVGAGSVLGDLIRSGAVGVVELKEIFRQAQESRIIVNAHRINRGELPETGAKGSLEDFYFIEQDDPDQALKIIMDLVCDRVPGRFRLDPLEEIQVLSPMHKGTVGTAMLNERLRDALNPAGAEVSRGGTVFRVGDKVMQVRNNYDKEVFNGDIGRIASLDGERQEMVVTFDGTPVPYDYGDLDELTPAYAISVHKSQGSEYPAVILPLLTQHYVLLQRNLIYTAVTRGKRLVIIVGSKKAVAMGVRNDRVMRRHTYLAERLKGLVS